MQLAVERDEDEQEHHKLQLRGWEGVFPQIEGLLPKDFTKLVMSTTHPRYGVVFRRRFTKELLNEIVATKIAGFVVVIIIGIRAVNVSFTFTEITASGISEDCQRRNHRSRSLSVETGWHVSLPNDYWNPLS